jgi:pimeloyl-ACP methyl ester carboxylesterase
MHFDVSGVRVHYERHGHGRPLLWLHGFMGAGSDWRYQFPDVAEGFELIAPDLRGHGASTGAHAQFSFRQAAHDMLALLSHLRVEQVSGIGISGGGITLLHMAIIQPGLIDAAVLVSVPPRFPEEARAFQRAFTPELLPAQELELMRQRHKGGREQVERLFSSARGLADDTDDVDFTTEMLARVTGRSLLVFGDRDPLYPVTLALDMYASLPNAALWVVPNAGHAPVFAEHAARFRDEALQFLSEPTAEPLAG